MQKLDSLRQLLLERLGLQPENLLVSVRAGEVSHYYSPPDRGANSKFAVDYSVNITIWNFGSAPEVLLFLVSGWLSRHQPGHPPNCIKFELDRLDNSEVDVAITVKGLKQTFSPQIQADGTLIMACPAEHLEPIIYPPYNNHGNP